MSRHSETGDHLGEIYEWIDQIKFSRPKRNIARDFSDGGKNEKQDTPPPPPVLPYKFFANSLRRLEK